MRKLALSLVLLAAAGLSTAALAADSTATGKIKALDAKVTTANFNLEPLPAAPAAGSAKR